MNLHDPLYGVKAVMLLEPTDLVTLTDSEIPCAHA